MEPRQYLWLLSARPQANSSWWESKDQKIFSAEILCPRLINISHHPGVWHIRSKNTLKNRAHPSGVADYLEFVLRAPRFHPPLNQIIDQPVEFDPMTPIYNRFCNGCRFEAQIDRGARNRPLLCSVDVCQIAVPSRKDKADWRRRAVFGLPQVNKPQRGRHAFFLVPSVCRPGCFVDVVKYAWACLWIGAVLRSAIVVWAATLQDWFSEALEESTWWRSLTTCRKESCPHIARWGQARF